MLNQVGLRFEDLRHIYIAGGFGRYLDLENATVIGLIPICPGEISLHRQLVAHGSYMVVVSQDYRQRQLDLARRMTYLELNTDPAYMGNTPAPCSSAYRPRAVSICARQAGRESAPQVWVRPELSGTSA